VPTQFVHSFDLPGRVIPEGGCLGIIVYNCRASDIQWFFDSTQYPTSLKIPPSTVYVIPEFPPWIMLPSLMMLTLAAAGLLRKRKQA
jgi:hypothetical protein